MYVIHLVSVFISTFVFLPAVCSQAHGQFVRRTLKTTTKSNNLERVHALKKNDAIKSFYGESSAKDQSYLKSTNGDRKKIVELPHEHHTPNFKSNHAEEDVLNNDKSIKDHDSNKSQNTSIHHRELLGGGEFFQRLFNLSLFILNIFDIFDIIPDPVKPTSPPTVSPKAPPVATPTKRPTKAPTKLPTKAPTKLPTKAPTKLPTKAPTQRPTKAPTNLPTRVPTKLPTKAPTQRPTKAPTKLPTRVPTKLPTKAPTKGPTKVPTKLPTKAPTKQPTPPNPPSSNPIFNAPPQPECNPNLSFIIFSGHDMVCSMNISAVNVTWSTPFVYDSNSSRFLWCGQYTYDVIIAKGEKDFKSLNRTYDELVDMANNDSTIRVITTQEQGIYVTDFVAGAAYTVLVLARTDSGHKSANRYAALVQMAAENPLLKPGYKRTVTLDDPLNGRGSWSAEFDRENSTVTFKGSYPDEVSDIQKDDFFYVIGSDGTSQLTKPIQRLTNESSEIVTWSYVPVDIGDVYETLDLSADINDKWGDLSKDEDTIDFIIKSDDLSLLDQMEAFPDPVKAAFCKIAEGIEDTSCFDAILLERRVMLEAGGVHIGRRLACCSRLKKAVLKVINVAVKVVVAVASVALEVVDKINSIVDFLEVTLDQTFTFLDIDKSAKLSCAVESQSGDASGEFELGVGFDFSARAQVSITVGVAIIGNPIQLKQASLRVFGGIGARAYAMFAASASREFAPRPIRLFQLSNTFTIFAGPVPIIITNQPALKAFIAATASVESEAVAVAQFGFEYSMLFEFDSSEFPPFKKPTASFIQRPPLEEEPEFSLRLRAEAEIGATLEWNVLFFGLLQATVAADAGLNPKIEVGTDLEALVITRPFFYTLNEFAIDLFFRVRVSLGLNNALAEVFEAISGSAEPACRFEIDDFELPKLKNIANATATPGPLEQAVVAAQGQSGLLNRTDLTLDDLETLGIFKDTFSDAIAQLTASIPFAVEFVIFEKNIQLLGIPVINMVPGDVAVCQGDNAIVLNVRTELDTSLIPFLDGLKDGLWFGNFDGSILSENTAWRLQNNPNDPTSVTMRLPRSSTQRFYNVEEGANVILRATPELLPFPPKSQFAKADLNELFPAVGSFECCLDVDCTNKNLPQVIASNEVRFCSSAKVCSKRIR